MTFGGGATAPSLFIFMKGEDMIARKMTGATVFICGVIAFAVGVKLLVA